MMMMMMTMVMMTMMMTIMMTMLWRDSAQDAEHAFQLSGCSCTGSHLILLIIFYLYLLFIFSLSSHYIYLYLFFIFYLNLLLQGISLHLPYHLLSSFMLSPPPDWDWNAVSKYRDGREASILDPTKCNHAFATSEFCELIQGCEIHGSVAWEWDLIFGGSCSWAWIWCVFVFVFFLSSFFDLLVRTRWSQLQRCLLGGS